MSLIPISLFTRSLCNIQTRNVNKTIGRKIGFTIRRNGAEKKKEEEGSSLIILFLSFSIPTSSVFDGNFRRSAQNVDESYYPGRPPVLPDFDLFGRAK